MKTLALFLSYGSLPWVLIGDADAEARYSEHYGTAHTRRRTRRRENA